MSSIGKDLARIRHFKKLTLQDLHTKTRISLEILEKLEGGTLFTDPVENEVYARSYTRTYARSLGIDDEVITEALDQQKEGNYKGMLLDLFPGIVGKTTPRQVTPDDEKKEEPEERSDSEKAREPESDSKSEKAADPGEAPESGSPAKKSSKETDSTSKPASDSPLKSPGTSEEKPEQKSGADAKAAKPISPARQKRSAEQIDWAAMGKRFSSPSRRSSGWILGLGIVLIFVAATLWIAFQTDLFEELFNGDEATGEQVSEPPSNEPSSGNETELGLDLGESVQNPADARPGADADGPTPTRLDTTLYLTIHAAYGPLDPVRVWSDLKPRFDPYWIEAGEAMQFEFQDTIRVRSQYEESLLFLNGHRIDNAREEYYNPAEQSVELTRSLFSPESEWAAPRELELPDTVAVPDTIRMRPIFN